MEHEITRADALVLIYAVDKLDTVVRVRNYWLPLIRRLLKEANRTQVCNIHLNHTNCLSIGCTCCTGWK